MPGYFLREFLASAELRQCIARIDNVEEGIDKEPFDYERLKELLSEYLTRVSRCWLYCSGPHMKHAEGIDEIPMYCDYDDQLSILSILNHNDKSFLQHMVRYDAENHPLMFLHLFFKQLEHFCAGDESFPLRTVQDFCGFVPRHCISDEIGVLSDSKKYYREWELTLRAYHDLSWCLRVLDRQAKRLVWTRVLRRIPVEIRRRIFKLGDISFLGT